MNLKIRILEHLQKEGKKSIPNLSKLTRTSSPTIKKLLEELMSEGLIVEQGLGRSAGGRRPGLYGINPNSRFILGIDIGRYNVHLGVFNLSSQLVNDIRIVPQGLETGVAMGSLLRKEVDELLQTLDIHKGKVLGAGIAVPGLIDIRTGRSYSYFTGHNEPLDQYFSNLLRLPAHIEHDTRAMALGEAAFGLAKDLQNVLCLNIGSGIGLSMILNGKLYKGTAGFSGEFGHIPMENSGELCYCGKIGCLETFASSTAMVRKARKDMQQGLGTLLTGKTNANDIHFRNILDAAEEGDHYCIDLFSAAGQYLGKGIAFLIHLFNPERIIIGGEMARARNLLLNPIQQGLNAYTIPRILQDTDIRISEIGDHAGLMGTAALVLDKVMMNSSINKKQ